MSAHDPALVERLAQAAEDWLDATDPFDELDAYDRERIARMLTGKHLDLLAAEGRLCEPGEVAHLRSYAERLQDDAIRWHDGFTAEVERLRAALAEVLEVLRTSRGAGDAARVAREVLADPEPLIDPDCRDGKHSSCVGDPCECECHG